MRTERLPRGMPQPESREAAVKRLEEIEQTKREIKAQISSSVDRARREGRSIHRDWLRRAKDKLNYLTIERAELRNMLPNLPERGPAPQAAGEEPSAPEPAAETVREGGGERMADRGNERFGDRGNRQGGDRNRWKDRGGNRDRRNKRGYGGNRGGGHRPGIGEEFMFVAQRTLAPDVYDAILDEASARLVNRPASSSQGKIFDDTASQQVYITRVGKERGIPEPVVTMRDEAY